MRLLLGVAALAVGANAAEAGTIARGIGEVKNIAIIGAGAAGSSAAYHLHKYAEEEGLLLNVTLFEKTNHIGGRTLTVNPFNDPELRVELGASIFIKDNRIMYNASRTFGLNLSEPKSSEPTDYTVIWDGETIVFRSEKCRPRWWNAVKLLLRYGLAPYRAMQLVKRSVGTFLQLYEEPYFPFRSLTQRAFELGLLRLTGITGAQFLQENKINGDFVRDLMQSATRVNYASNMAFIHGLEALISFATEGAVSVSGGNFQIFEKMVQDSGATYRPNTTIAAIAFHKGSNKPGSIPRYVLSTKETQSKAKAARFQTTFDSIIIASPWQYSDIEAGEGVIKHRIDAIPYMKLHVTLFTSPLRLQASYFGLEPGTPAPSNVYTTLGKDETAHAGPEGVGRTGFYAISTLRTVTNPKTQGKEYLYKIFSAEAVNSTFLSAILGTDIPSSFVTSESRTEVEPISWYYPHWFYSYPIELPRVTFQDPIIGRGLYYTSGIESFVSTMETSALMGMNVARLIADDFAGITRRGGRAAPASRAGPSRGEFHGSAREDFWDSMDSEMGVSMDFLGADEL
ncbi:hypothetical protein E4U42_002490 [Claviceps africana]|uniref:Prenylcysteine lyase domain-containing protein n=1 Tax=Claviceps africana TaxID=83212 RepID=A0A8K0NL21_9HYPO|nr:hypothetical protein E4U42_002490 [Claviceps africana]